METPADRHYRQRAKQAKLELQMPQLLPAMVGALQTRPAEYLDRWLTHPGFGLEPAHVWAIYRQAEWGYPMSQVDLFDDMIEGDGHLRTTVHKRNLAVSGKERQIMPGGDRPIDIAAAELCAAMLAETNLEDAIIHQLSTRPTGYAGTEILWEKRDGDVIPSWFVNVHARRFVFDELGRPNMIAKVGDMKGTPLAPGGWIFGRNAVVGPVVRSGLMRTALWFAMFKRWSWRDWVIYGEKFGIPSIWGRYDSDATEEDRDALEEAVTNIGEDGQAVMSKKTEIEIKESTSSNSNNLHAGIVAEANLEISKLITGSTLTLEQGGAGSFALGKVHQSGAFEYVQADARLVNRLLREYLFRPMLVFNGLADARTPRQVIHVSQESDPLTRAQVAEKLQGMGLAIDGEQMREEFQLRAPPVPDRELKAIVDSPRPLVQG